MRVSLLRIAGALLAIGALHVSSLAGVTEKEPGNLPPWLSQVADLNSGAPQSFQFRSIFKLPGFNIITYVAWSPPDHRSIVLCDSYDGLPLMIAVDGEGWMYDLVGGQIVHLQTEPKFDMVVQDAQANLHFGIESPEKKGGIHVNLPSFFTGPNFTELKSTEDATGRFLAASNSRGSKAVLQVTPSGPPLPLKFMLAIPQLTPAGEIECDDFHFGDRLPHWHHPLDPETLAKDVPYLDATNTQGIPPNQQERLQMALQLLFGEASFVLRPALRNPALRQQLEQKYPKLDFKQMELHDKLLKKAWLHTLDIQESNPAKFAPAIPSDLKE